MFNTSDVTVRVTSPMSLSQLSRLLSAVQGMAENERCDLSLRSPTHKFYTTVEQSL